MIQIDEPPDQPACSTCGALTWLWSPRREAWVCFVTGPDRTVIRLHGCRHAQDYKVWREVKRGAEPSDEYLAVRAALAKREEVPDGDEGV